MAARCGTTTRISMSATSPTASWQLPTRAPSPVSLAYVGLGCVGLLRQPLRRQRHGDRRRRRLHVGLLRQLHRGRRHQRRAACPSPTAAPLDVYGYVGVNQTGGVGLAAGAVSRSAAAGRRGPPPAPARAAPSRSAGCSAAAGWTSPRAVSHGAGAVGVGAGTARGSSVLVETNGSLSLGAAGYSSG